MTTNTAQEQQAIEPQVNSLTVSGQYLLERLKFVAPAISNEETRFYLNAVYFDKQPGKALRLVTTDGHRLHAIYMGEVSELEFKFLMPKAAVKALLKMVNKRGKYTLVFEAGRLLVSGTDIEGFEVKELDGKFPEYARVIPASEDNKTLEGYNASYLVDTFKAFTVLDKAVRVTTRGDASEMGVNSPIVFEATDQGALIVVMPMRS